jgi:hypothetical protein
VCCIHRLNPPPSAASRTLDGATATSKAQPPVECSRCSSVAKHQEFIDWAIGRHRFADSCR